MEGKKLVPKRENRGDWSDLGWRGKQIKFLQHRGGEQLSDYHGRKLLFISAPRLRTAPLGVQEASHNLLQHQSSGQLLGISGPTSFQDQEAG